jgi:hypothetical protein
MTERLNAAHPKLLFQNPALLFRAVDRKMIPNIHYFSLFSLISIIFECFSSWF